MYAKYGKIMKDVWEDAISKCGPHAVAYLQDVHVKKALELLDRLCEVKQKVMLLSGWRYCAVTLQ
jgi:hypothetical protein